MPRMLIFVGTRAALEKYDMAGVPIMTRQLQSQFIETLKTFIANPNGQLVLTTLFVTGYRVPSDTFIVFDESWPYDRDHPNTIQAKGRVRRSIMEPDWLTELGFSEDEIKDIDDKARTNLRNMRFDGD